MPINPLLALSPIKPGGFFFAGKPFQYWSVPGPLYRIPATFFYPSESAMFHLLIHHDAKQGNMHGLNVPWQLSYPRNLLKG